MRNDNIPGVNRFKSSSAIGIRWCATISVNGVNYHLLVSDSKTACIQIRKLAEKARDNGTFDTFLHKWKLKKAQLGRSVA